MATPIQCKAMVCRQAGKPLVMETITVAPPQANEVRVKIIYSSVCHTDELARSGRDTETPISEEDGVILGHEAVGIVESIGEGVTSVAVGDYVLPTYIPQCNECRFCKSPKSNLCQKIRGTQGRGVMPNGTTRFTDAQGRPIRHFMGLSAFSQYTVVADISVVKIPEAAVKNCLDKLPIVGCGWTTGRGTIQDQPITADDSVAIAGLGAVGLAAVQSAHEKGAKQIIAIDINPQKFELAKKLGATHFINPLELGEKSLPAAIMELTEGGWGVDYAIEAVGRAQLMTDLLHATTKGWGKAIMVGVVCGEEISTKPFYLVSGRNWTGLAFGNVKPSRLPGMMQEIADGTINVDDFITGQLTLADINKAFDEMHTPGSLAIRMTVDMWQ